MVSLTPHSNHLGSTASIFTSIPFGVLDCLYVYISICLYCIYVYMRHHRNHLECSTGPTTRFFLILSTGLTNN